MGDFAKFVLAISALVALPLGSIACVSERVEYTSASAQIEQLRSDLQSVSAQRSEDAVGQATQWNQIIASKKRWNTIPFVNLWIPDGWNRIEPIVIPE